MNLILIFQLITLAKSAKSINFILEGNWTMTKIDLTEDGLENPDTISNYSFSLSAREQNRTYISEIYSTSLSTDSKNQLNSQSQSTDSTYQFELDLDFPSPDNKTIGFNLTLNNDFNISGEFHTSINGIISSTGSYDTFTYTFTFLSSYRAQLSLFNQNTGKVTIFRFWKEFELDKSWGFGKYATYLFRRMLFTVF